MNLDSLTAISGLKSTIQSSSATVASAVESKTTLFERVKELSTDTDSFAMEDIFGGTSEERVNNTYNNMESLAAEYEELQSEIAELEEIVKTEETNIEIAQQQLTELYDSLSEFEALLNAENEDKQANIEAKAAEEAEKAENEQELSDAKDELNAEKAELDANEAAYKEIMSQIQATQQNYANTQNAKRNQIMAQCQSEYDEEKDGDYNTFVANRLKSEMGSDESGSVASGLMSKKDVISQQISANKASIESSNSRIASISDYISQNKSNIAKYESNISNNKSNIAKYTTKIANIHSDIQTVTNTIKQSTATLKYANSTLDSNEARMSKISEELNPEQANNMSAAVTADMSEEDKEFLVEATEIDFSQNTSTGLSALKLLAGKENLVNEEDTVLDQSEMQTLADKYGFNFLSVSRNAQDKVAATKEEVDTKAVIEFFA